MNLEINIPEIVAEVTEAHKRYEQALSINDLDIIDSLFWNNALTLRYGPNGTLIGHAAISAFRRARNIKGVEAHHSEHARHNLWSRLRGQQYRIQTAWDRPHGAAEPDWVRMPEGWRIVSAHVSDEPANR